MINGNKDEEKKFGDNHNIAGKSQNGDEEKNIDQILNQLEKSVYSLSKTLCLPPSKSSPSMPLADGCSVIDVAFEARSPGLSDFNGIKQLLQQLFVKLENEELTGLSNIVIEQDFVGCVLKRDNEDDSDDESEDSSDDSDEIDDTVFSVNTVINISDNQNLPCIKKICDLLIAKCHENYKEDPSRIANLVGDPSKRIGLIISERYFYIPPQVALPSYRSLKQI